MAKGNDGNYLQHSLEVSAATHLLGFGRQGFLQISLTHAMEPYEPCQPVPGGQTRKSLEASLAAATKARVNGESVLVDAYRRTKASRDSYPNTGELLAAMVGRERLVGAMTEIEAKKYSALLRFWNNSTVQVVNASWRQEVASGGAFFQTPKFPWIFSMDPMTYHEDGFSDDDNIYRADRNSLSQVLRQYVSSGQPGIALFFVFAVRPNIRSLFWHFAADVALDTGMALSTFWLTHQGGNRNLAAVLSWGVEVSTEWLPNGLNVGS